MTIRGQEDPLALAEQVENGSPPYWDTEYDEYFMFRMVLFFSLYTNLFINNYYNERVFHVWYPYFDNYRLGNIPVIRLQLSLNMKYSTSR